MKFSCDSLYGLLEQTALKPWLDTLPQCVEKAFSEVNNGHMPAWENALANLPKVTPSSIDLSTGAVHIGCAEDLDDADRVRLDEALRAFHPWRKGPFDFFGTYIDTEWRSNMKWDRLKNHISPLHDRLVLDIGSGNGYYLCRMLGEGAKLALGIDPFWLYVMQHQVIRHYLPEGTPCHVLPLSMEDLPSGSAAFDTVFSMGVLYHRRSPIDHLLELKHFLRPGGELVLETLVVDGEAGYTLLPQKRYAQMRNVWFIPSVPTLEQWLKRCGYTTIQVADASHTTCEEQRSTEWMRFESLPDFLDPQDSSKTIEGYPAPMRAILVARN